MPILSPDCNSGHFRFRGSSQVQKGDLNRRNRKRESFTGLSLIETIKDTENNRTMMAVQAAPWMRKNHPAKKSAAQQKTHEGEIKNSLYAVSEHSLSGFLEDVPDIYSVSDLKVRYR